MIQIQRDHPTFLLKPQIKALTASFLHQHGFNYFQYLRCFNDGAFSFLTNETGIFELLSLLPPMPVVYSSFTEEHEQQHSYWFLWDEELPAIPVQIVREQLHLHHGLTLVRRSKEYYDMIAVALPSPRLNVGSFYMTKYKAIEHFIQQFDRNHQDIIRDINKNPIIVPQPYRDANYKKICLHKGRIEVQGPHGLIHITSQELACLRMLQQGQSYKHIAKALSLSPRTVETYISRLKERSGIPNRQDLGRLISICM